jgi:putative hydrolase of the HAD superfamily
MAKPRAVLFDLDQTLLDRDRSLVRFLDWQWAARPLLRSMPRKAFVDAFLRLDARGTVWKDVVYARLLAERGLPTAGADALLADYLQVFPGHAVAYDHALTALRALKDRGLALGLVTNGRRDLQSAVATVLGLDSLLDTQVISEAVGLRKPDPAIFRLAAERLAVPVTACVFVGDNPDADVRGAHGAGMRAIWKENDAFPPPDGAIPAGVLRDYRCLVAIVDALVA